MSRMFISHSSTNNAIALALGQWLESQGWSDYFLDVHADRGIAPGERWMEALSGAVDATMRCSPSFNRPGRLPNSVPCRSVGPGCIGKVYSSKELGHRPNAKNDVALFLIPFAGVVRYTSNACSSNFSDQLPLALTQPQHLFQNHDTVWPYPAVHEVDRN